MLFVFGFLIIYFKMGSKLSIDKHVSNLEDLLELNTEFLDKIKFESNIPDCIT